MNKSYLASPVVLRGTRADRFMILHPCCTWLPSQQRPLSQVELEGHSEGISGTQPLGEVTLDTSRWKKEKTGEVYTSSGVKFEL